MATLTAQQLAAQKRRWELEDRAYEVAQREIERQQVEAERAQAEAERAARYKALMDVANVYSSQDVDTQRQAALSRLSDVLSAAGVDIGGAEQQFLSSLVAPTAYQDVPLVELGAAQNPLLRALQAEGVDMSQLQQEQQQQTNIQRQLAEMARRSMGQLNVGEQNYLNALRQAGTQYAQQARTGLAQQGAAQRAAIGSQYDELANQIALARAQALADAAAYAPTKPAGGAAPEAPSAPVLNVPAPAPTDAFDIYTAGTTEAPPPPTFMAVEQPKPAKKKKPAAGSSGGYTVPKIA